MAFIIDSGQNWVKAQAMMYNAKALQLDVVNGQGQRGLPGLWWSHDSVWTEARDNKKGQHYID